MRNFLPLLTGLCFLLIIQASPAKCQNLRNDGFQRRNGQMHVMRNGQLRPMTSDVRLPTGAVVTKDGFIRAANGTRKELREGQGCDLKGNVVAVVPVASGGLALSSPTRGQSRSTTPAVVQVTLADLFGHGQRRDDDDYEDDKEQGKKEKEWQREARKRREEYARERSKKWKHKWKESKGSDD